MGPDEAHGPKYWKVEKRDGSRLEPANLDILRQWVASGQIGADDLILNEEIADWIRASEVAELSDLFGKQVPVSDSPQAPADTEKEEQEVEVPDCAFHPGRTAAEICVGCGKFICEECRERLEGKVHCRRCMAEKQAGVEPGAPVGPGASGQVIAGAPASSAMSRLAIVSLVFSAAAVAASVITFVPRINIVMAAVAGSIAFVAALLGWFALSSIRLSGMLLRGRGIALAGLISGCVILIASLSFVFYSTRQPGSGEGSGLVDITRGRSGRQPRQFFSKKAKAEREAEAKKLLEQAGEDLGRGRLKRAITRCEAILDLYPETDTAKLIKRRLPILEQALATKEAEAEALKLQNEQSAATRFEHAMGMNDEGDQATALDLLKSVVSTYPKTETAKQARAEIARIEKAAADEEASVLDREASQLAAQADQLMESEKYSEAARLYERIAADYSKTPTAAATKAQLEEARLLSEDTSESEFRKLQKKIETKTYAESVALLQDFIKKYPKSNRISDVVTLQDENRTNERDADSIYNFGRAYFEDNKYDAALRRYRELINEYPRSRWISQAKEEYQKTLEQLKQ